MKKYLLLVFVLIAGLLPARAESSQGKYFIAAILFGEKEVVPATLRFSNRDSKTMAHLYLNGEMRVAPVVLREVPDRVVSNPKLVMFDAVFVSQDGLSSIVLTGELNSVEAGRDGYGTIVVHTAAKFGAAPDAGLTRARIDTGIFSLTKHEEEQNSKSGGDNPSK